MEFFRQVPVSITEHMIQEKLTLDNLSVLSNDVLVIGSQDVCQAEIGCVWGEFTLTRSVINGGVRFALVECPNALTWSITTGFEPNPKAIVLHLTINRTKQSETFIEEIEDFLDDQLACLKKIEF